MLIKHVTIQGFKTFAKRTDFVFDPGVTAIVGPNGSGKSNIVDAIRWCLGEQSFSLLRSKKTSDVIFSGSDQKARLGMAQVSITLDNSQGELPVDFAEIEVTRRAYRDGDNEYLLNGRQVRLQDITDLLAQTGLGRRTYALIGQGLIDKVLSIAPEELRGLFEEAAGITGYQNKRTTTLRRLDATQQNLTRVHDVLTELTPRLGLLRKQAERANERAELASALRSMLREWYGFQWHATVKESKRSQEATLRLKALVDADLHVLGELAQQIEQFRSRQSQLRSEVGELHRESSGLHRDAESVAREVAVAQERLRHLSSRQEEAHRDLAPLRLQAETNKLRIVDLKSEVALSETTYLFDFAAVQHLQAEVDERQQSRLHLQESLIIARKAFEQVQARQADTSSRSRQMDERRSALTVEQETVKTATEVANREQSKWKEELHQQQQILLLHEQAVAGVQQEAASILALREESRGKIANAVQSRQDAERAADRLQTRYDLLTRLHREGAGYASGVRSVLQASGTEAKDTTSALRGIVGTVAALLQVPAHLDKAIETALGGAFQNIVTISWDDTQAAIDFLKRTRNGRATFLPLDRLSVLPAIPAPKTSGILGNAAQLIKYNAQIDTAVQQLLNRVWVAESLPAARRALDAFQGSSRPTVVTLDGEIVRPGGAVTGGSDQNRHDESILARERELRELPAEIQRTTARLRQAQEEVTRLVDADEKLAQSYVQAQEKLNALARQSSILQTQAEEARRQHDRAQQALRWHEDRASQIGQELALLTEQRSSLAAQGKELENEAAEAGNFLQVAETHLQEAGSEELFIQLGDLRAAAAQSQSAWQNRQVMLVAQERSLQNTLEQIHSKEGTIATLGSEQNELSARIAELSKREDELNRVIANHIARLTPAEELLSSLEANQSALETQERQLQEQLRRNESTWNSAQLHQQRTEDQLQQLRHDIAQDLGFVLLEVGEEQAYQPPLPWDAVVEQLPEREEVSEGLEVEVRELRARLNRVNNINPDAPREYAEATERHQHLLKQSTDLESALAGLRKIVRELDEIMETELSRTFAAVSEQFTQYFQQLFNGGTAKLLLAEPDNIANSGIEIIARPPGKRPQSLALLSGGERTLTALALIFAILRVSPTPFCVLDEVDAALDEANVDRFRQTVEELSHGTQFIIITHNRRTLEGTNAIYGITMASDGASRVISLQLQGEKIVQQDTPGATRPASEVDTDIATIEELVKL